MQVYTSYYAGSDVQIFVVASDKNLTTDQAGHMVMSGNTPIMLDKASFISYQAMRINSNPVYGIGKAEYMFKNRGNDLVQGNFGINFTDERYIKVAITNALNPNYKNAKQAQEAMEMSTDDFRRQRDLSRRYGQLFSKEKGNGIDSLMKLRGFDIMIVFNNGNNIHKDKNKILFLRECEIDAESLQAASGEATQISRIYQFTAKRID